MSAIINLKKLVPEASVPKNANPLDTGYDLVALSAPEIVGEPINTAANIWKRIDYIQYRTGIAISPQANRKRGYNGEGMNKYFFTLLFPRSSVSKYNLILANSIGLVDNPYRGEILLRFKYIWQPEDYKFDVTVGPSEFIAPSVVMLASPNMKKIYAAGDKIAQIAAFELNPIDFKEVEDLDETDRGAGGFGSTGQ